MLLTISYSVFSVDFEKYEFTPVKVNDSFKIERIATNSTGSIIVSGYNVLESQPTNYISNTVILKSNDNGINWTIIYTDSNETLEREERHYFNIKYLEYLDNGNIYGFAHNGYIIRSMDGGSTWIKDSLGVFINPIGIKFIDNKNGVTLWNKSVNFKTNSLLFFTNDGGQTWNEINVPLADLLENQTEFIVNKFYYFEDESISFLMNDYYYEKDSIKITKTHLITTKDYGQTWEMTNIELPIYQNYIQFLDYDHIILFGILKSKTHFDNSGNPFGHDIILESFDRGASWDTLLINIDTNTNSRLSQNFEYFDDKYFLIQGVNSGISYFERGKDRISTLFPNNILELKEKYNYQQLYDYIKFGDKILVSSGGGYLFYIDFKSPVTSIEDTKIATNLDIYPNPVPNNQFINLKLYSIISGRLNISIIDINGKVVQTYEILKNSFNDKIELNSGYKLTSGAYFLQIEFGNGIVQRKHFIVE